MLLSKLLQVFLLFFGQVCEKLLIILPSFAHVDTELHAWSSGFFFGGVCDSATLFVVLPPAGQERNYMRNNYNIFLELFRDNITNSVIKTRDVHVCKATDMWT